MYKLLEGLFCELLGELVENLQQCTAGAPIFETVLLQMLVDSPQDPTIDASLVDYLQIRSRVRKLSVNCDHEVVSESPVERPSVLTITKESKNNIYFHVLVDSDLF